MDTTHWIAALFTIIGSLGLFLFGMKTLSDGLQKTAGSRLKKILHYMTSNRFAGVFTGFAITSFVQSSSATTVMVVSFVNAGLLSLLQATGVIMGANIGTTVTGWIVAILGFKVNISSLALPAIGIGIPFLLVKKLNAKSWGEIIIGFGLLFLGLSLLKDSVPDIKDNPQVLHFLTDFVGRGYLSYVIFIMVGTLLTIVVQSSSAAMAITITMAYAGWIDFPTAAAIILGENIGTTITANLAALSGNKIARKSSLIHTLFNIAGIVWMTFLFPYFLSFIDMIVPLPVDRNTIPQHLAMFHTMFNIINTLIFIWFSKLFVRIVNTIIPTEKETEITQEEYRLPYISTGLQHTPELNLLKAHEELHKMAELVEKMFSALEVVFKTPDKNLKTEIEELKKMEDYTDQMEEQLSAYLVSCSQENLSEQSLENVNEMIRITSEIENIGDSCFNLVILCQKRYDKNITFSQKGIDEILEYFSTVKNFLSFNSTRLNRPITQEEYETAFQLEKTINRFRNALKKSARKRLKKGSSVKVELLFIDMVKHLEHIGDHSLIISKSLRKIR